MDSGGGSRALSFGGLDPDISKKVFPESGHLSPSLLQGIFQLCLNLQLVGLFFYVRSFPNNASAQDPSGTSLGKVFEEVSQGIWP